MTETQDPARLASVARYVDLHSAADNDLASLCELATLLCNVPSAAINLVDDQRQHTIAGHGLLPGVCAAQDSLCAVTVKHEHDVYLEDARTDARFAGNPWVDGRISTVRLYAAALLRSPEGAVVGTICIFDPEEPRAVERRQGLASRRRHVLAALARQVVDVLELHVRTHTLAEANRELARSQEHLTAFAAQISHDLRTPLTAILGFSELLCELPSVEADPVAVNYTQRCLSSSQRMLLMINELLGYARLGGTLNRQHVRLDDVMSGVMDDLGDLAGQGTVHWTGEEVLADPAQLRVLLQNLVSNALTYRSDVPAEVRITAFDSPIGYELVVADNGSGIPTERRADVLQPLTRLRTDVPGTGIGLATCNRIVAVHGGTLHIEDTPGGGTTITVVLPH